jgi:AbrB family looped-hinge helix DNA binding protein
MEPVSGEEHRVYRSRVDQSGRIVLPAEVREELGLEPGSSVLLVRDKEGVRLDTPDHALAELQAYFRSFVPDGVSLVDELIEERRAEAARE